MCYEVKINRKTNALLEVIYRCPKTHAHATHVIFILLSMGKHLKTMYISIYFELKIERVEVMELYFIHLHAT